MLIDISLQNYFVHIGHAIIISIGSTVPEWSIKMKNHSLKFCLYKILYFWSVTIFSVLIFCTFFVHRFVFFFLFFCYLFPFVCFSCAVFASLFFFFFVWIYHYYGFCVVSFFWSQFVTETWIRDFNGFMYLWFYVNSECSRFVCLHFFLILRLLRRFYFLL